MRHTGCGSSSVSQPTARLGSRLGRRRHRGPRRAPRASGRGRWGFSSSCTPRPRGRPTAVRARGPRSPHPGRGQGRQPGPQPALRARVSRRRRPRCGAHRRGCGPSPCGHLMAADEGSPGCLVDVGSPVVVGIPFLVDPLPPVDAVAAPQDRGCQHRRERRAGEHTHLDVVIPRSLPTPKASSPMSSDTVKPTPASTASPRTSTQRRLGIEAGPGESGHQVGRRRTCRSSCPTTRPTTIPSATGSDRTRRRPRQPPMVTPAEKNAKTGTATPAEMGRKRCSKCSARPGPASGPPAAAAAQHRHGEAQQHPGDGGVHPEAWTSAQVSAASGSSSHHERTRRCTSTMNTTSGSERRAAEHGESCGVEERDDRDREQVVHDRQGQQERPQRRRQMRADHRQHREREGDVGRGRDRPAPQGAAASPALTSTYSSAGTTIPPTAATTGSAARRGSRRSPATNSRLSSSPATKKKIASRPSAAHSPSDRFRCSASGPTCGHAARRTSPPTASWPTPARPRSPAAAARRRRSRGAAARRPVRLPASSPERTAAAHGVTGVVRDSEPWAVSGVGRHDADQTSLHTVHPSYGGGDVHSPWVA